MSTVIVVGYSALMLVMGGICACVSPGWAVAVWASMGALSALAIVVGVRGNAPARRWPWWMMSAAITAMTSGDILYCLYDYSHSYIMLVFSDMCYIATLPLIMIGLAALTKSSTILSDRSLLLDLLIIICVVILFTWIFFVSPLFAVAEMSFSARTLTAIYVMGDVLVVIIMVRLVMATERSWVVFLLAAGATGLLVANVTYALSELHDGWDPHHPAVVGYLIFYVSWGAAALHPSMAYLAHPIAVRPRDLRGGWSIRLRLCLAIPSGTIIVESLTGNVRDGVVIALASGVMCEIVMIQLADLVGKYREALARERTLREACSSLVGAVRAGDVDTAIRYAVGRLMPPRVGHSIVVMVRDLCPDANRRELSTRPAMADLDTVPVPAAGAGSRLVRTHLLHPALQEQLHPYTETLICPLLGGWRQPRGLMAGAVLIAASEGVLMTIRDAVEVVVSQAALALERITLSDTVNSIDVDKCLGMVVGSSADAIVIVDKDERILCASPPFTTISGMDPLALSSLRDVIDANDYDQVLRVKQRAEESSDIHGVHDVWSLRRPGGDYVRVEISCRDLRRDHIVRGFVITMREMTDSRPWERERIQRMLRRSGGWKNRLSLLNRFKDK